MAAMPSAKQAAMLSVGFPKPMLVFHDLESLAEEILTQALECCAGEMRVDSSSDVVERLRRGDDVAFSYLYGSLMLEIAQQLGVLDGAIKGVYFDEYDVSPEDLHFGESARTTIISLIVWVQHKDYDLALLVKALDQALVRSYGSLIGTPWPRHLLEAHIVDDGDMKNRFDRESASWPCGFPLTEIWKR